MNADERRYKPQMNADERRYKPQMNADERRYNVTRVVALLPLLLFGSGFSALVYQVIWVRLLGLVFGLTVYAASAVLAAFMGGLRSAASSSAACRIGVQSPLKSVARRRSTSGPRMQGDARATLFDHALDRAGDALRRRGRRSPLGMNATDRRRT